MLAIEILEMEKFARPNRNSFKDAAQTQQVKLYLRFSIIQRTFADKHSKNLQLNSIQLPLVFSVRLDTKFL